MTGAKRFQQFAIVPIAALPPDSRVIVTVAGISIGVFNVDGELFALRNRCPHQGAPLCAGVLTDLVVPRFCGDEPPQRDLVRHGEVLRCPWHGWEFDMRTGEAVIPHGGRTHTYRAFVQHNSSRAAAQDSETPPDPVETFQVKLEDGLVVVEVPV